ncbi:MAG TPA: glycosyltransferase family 4 protein [Planctomycetaceae bacterium]|nr:glycosyltransferase family 4 protein [Planctomycetaceae bacterium]
MQVTFCQYDAEHYAGGPNTRLRRLLPRLKLRGIEPRVLFLTVTGSGPTVRALERAGIECRVTPWITWTEDRIRWILEALRESPPDVFVPHVVTAACYAARWVSAAGIPTVGAMNSDGPLNWALFDEFVAGLPEYRVWGLACVSELLELEARRRAPAEVDVCRIPGGVPLPGRSASPPGEVLRLVYAGRLVEEGKRARDVARALCRAVGEVPGVEAVLYGEGPDQPEIERILERDGQGGVRLGGLVDNDRIQEEMLRAHVFVQLSEYEGLSNALCEAMACGLVPVCLEIRSGTRELVSHGETGLLVEDRGDAFVGAIRRLRNDPQLWQRISQAAREKVARDYTLDAAAGGWVTFLERLAARAGSPDAIRIPRTIRLPPLRPGLACDDTRRPWLVKRGARWLWHRARALRAGGCDS